MFQYPIPVSGSNVYSKLGIKPDSYKEEIHKVKVVYLKKINDKIQLLTDFIELDTKNKEDITEEEKAQLKDYKIKIQNEGLNLIEAKKDLESFQKEVVEMNSFDPGNTDKRDEYDMMNPPAILLRTGYEIPEIFTNKKTMLTMVRKDLNRFFEEKKLQVYHPSDLLKDDFSSDFRYNKIVDKKEI